jgi:hypothetical protein
MSLVNWERAKVAALLAGGAILGAGLKSYFDWEGGPARPLPRQPAWRHGYHMRDWDRRRLGARG